MTPERTQRLGLWLALLAICGVGLSLRLVGLRYGLPAVYNPDEVAIMSRALAFAKGDLNPHNFLYPSFYFYALFAWEGLAAVWAVLSGAVGSLAAFQREFFLDPTRVYTAGRLLTALCGVATIAATFRLGNRLAGTTAGLCAALFLSIAPLHVRDSHYVKHDVPVTLLIVLAYLTYDRLFRDARAEPVARDRRLTTAAIVTGVAFSTHYYTIFLAIPLAWSAARGSRTPAQALHRIAVAGVIAAMVFFVLSPFVLLEPRTALSDIRANRQIVVERAVGTLGYLQTVLRYGSMLWRDTVGWPVVLLAVTGLAIAARRRPAQALWLLAFPVPFLLFITTTYPATRYLIPILPFVAVLAGIAVERMSDGRRRAAVAVVVVAASILPLRDSIHAGVFMRRDDTRTLAARFVEGRVPTGATILTQPYSVPLEPTAEVLREAVGRSGKDMPTKTRLSLERAPYPNPAYRLIYLGFGLDADKIYLPYERLTAQDGLAPIRAEHVAFVVLKRYNTPDPATLPFLTALAREGRRIAVFTPYRDGLGDARPEPFLHNTDARINAALERAGPVVEIWQIDGSGS